MERAALKTLWSRCLACEALHADESALLDELISRNDPLFLEVAQEVSSAGVLASPFAGLLELVAKAPPIPPPALESAGPVPTEEEIVKALYDGACIAIEKWHRGGKKGVFIDPTLLQDVQVAALKRVQKFRHGGKKTLREYAYMSCYFALRDLQREKIEALNAGDPGLVLDGFNQ